MGIAKKMENEFNESVKTMTSGCPKEVPTEMESLDDEKNELKTISLEKDSLMEELTKIKEINTKMENMMKEKDSKIQDLKTKLSNCIKGTWDCVCTL